MIPKVFKVFDSEGNYLRSFSTWKDAFNWKTAIMGRPDWEIREYWQCKPYQYYKQTFKHYESTI